MTSGRDELFHHPPHRSASLMMALAYLWLSIVVLEQFSKRCLQAGVLSAICSLVAGWQRAGH